MSSTRAMLDTYPRDCNVDTDKLVACIEVCFDCANACTYMQHCRVCAEVCRRCEQACRELMAAVS